MKSRTGRTTALTRAERAAQMPTGTAMTRAITVATMTRASVTIESSHNSMESRKANPKKVRTPPKVPRSQNAITAKMPQRISGGGACRTAWTPSEAPVRTALTKSNSQVTLARSQSTVLLTQSPSGILGTGQHLLAALARGVAGPGVGRLVTEEADEALAGHDADEFPVAVEDGHRVGDAGADRAQLV